MYIRLNLNGIRAHIVPESKSCYPFARTIAAVPFSAKFNFKKPKDEQSSRFSKLTEFLSKDAYVLLLLLLPLESFYASELLLYYCCILFTPTNYYYILLLLLLYFFINCYCKYKLPADTDSYNRELYKFPELGGTIRSGKSIFAFRGDRTRHYTPVITGFNRADHCAALCRN